MNLRGKYSRSVYHRLWYMHRRRRHQLARLPRNSKERHLILEVMMFGCAKGLPCTVTPEEVFSVWKKKKEAA